MHTKGCFGSRAYALLVAKGTAVNCTVVSNVSTCADSSTKIFVGTAASFFKDYANGDYTPAGPLVNKGANYEGMASVDLAGNRRLVGNRIDIGCYEARSSALIMIVR